MQLMLELRQQIEEGRLVPEQPMPSESELCGRYGVSRTVVREALRELVDQRLVYKVKGRGTFVFPPRKSDFHFVGSVTGSAEDLQASGRRVTTKVLQQELGRATTAEAADLQILEESPVVRLHRLRSADGQQLLLVRAALPASLFPGLERVPLENQSLYATLRRRYGVEPHAADRWIEAVLPDEYQAELLGVSESTPLLRIQSISWTEGGVRFEAYTAYHATEHARFYVGIR